MHFLRQLGKKCFVPTIFLVCAVNGLEFITFLALGSLVGLLGFFSDLVQTVRLAAHLGVHQGLGRQMGKENRARNASLAKWLNDLLGDKDTELPLLLPL